MKMPLVMSMLMCNCLLLLVTIISGHSHHSYGVRITNGSEANSNEKFPWMAVIMSRLYDFTTKKYSSEFSITCSATIVSKRFILTTSTCLYDVMYGECSYCFLHARLKDINKMQVFVGIWNVTGRGKPVAIKRLIPHQKFDNCTKKNDIALLELKKELCLKCAGLKSISLGSSQWIQVGQRATVAGWGPWCPDRFIYQNQTLNYLFVNIKKKSECHETLTMNKPQDTYLCAGSERGSIVGLGDFGGGLWIEESDVPLLIGIVSQTPTPCNMPYNAVFTRLYYYRKWILKYINRMH